jgi:hypothetical protein
MSMSHSPTLNRPSIATPGRRLRCRSRPTCCPDCSYSCSAAPLLASCSVRNHRCRRPSGCIWLASLPTYLDPRGGCGPRPARRVRGGAAGRRRCHRPRTADDRSLRPSAPGSRLDCIPVRGWRASDTRRCDRGLAHRIRHRRPPLGIRRVQSRLSPRARGPRARPSPVRQVARRYGAARAIGRNGDRTGTCPRMASCTTGTHPC